MRENRHRITLGTVVLAWLLAVCALGAFLVVASSSSAAVLRDAAPEQPIDYEDGPPISNAQIERQHDRAQACRTFLGYSEWPSARSWEWAVGRVYRGWLYALWLGRAGACADVRAMYERLERSVPGAARWAAERWNVDASWLISCAGSEGGLDASYVKLGATPPPKGPDTGWWQFLPGTWAWMSNAAWKAVYPPPPPRYKHIRSVVGQAYTAAWAFSEGYQSPGWQPLAPQWYGKGC